MSKLSKLIPRILYLMEQPAPNPQQKGGLHIDILGVFSFRSTFRCFCLIRNSEVKEFTRQQWGISFFIRLLNDQIY